MLFFAYSLAGLLSASLLSVASPANSSGRSVGALFCEWTMPSCARQDAYGSCSVATNDASGNELVINSVSKDGTSIVFRLVFASHDSCLDANLRSY